MRLPPFRPRFPWYGGDLQTLRNFIVRPRHDLSRWSWRRLELPMRDGSGDRLVALAAEPQAATGLPVILVHGLSGCSDSLYIRASAAVLLAAGHPVIRLDLRGAGASRPLCGGQYHAGRSQDLADALAGLPDEIAAGGVAVMAFSLGANMLGKYLAEQGEGIVRRAVMVSAPIDLAAAAARLERPRNWLYQRYLLARMKEESLAPAARLTEAERDAIRQARGIREFDDRFVAPHNGFAGSAEYYARCSALQFMAAIRAPTLVIHARDDPWIPAALYDRIEWRAHPNLVSAIAAGGGHVGFHDQVFTIAWHDHVAGIFLGNERRTPELS